jgi:hypothetical protein
MQKIREAPHIHTLTHEQTQTHHTYPYTHPLAAKHRQRCNVLTSGESLAYGACWRTSVRLHQGAGSRQEFHSQVRGLLGLAATHRCPTKHPSPGGGVEEPQREKAHAHLKHRAPDSFAHGTGRPFATGRVVSPTIRVPTDTRSRRKKKGGGGNLSSHIALTRMRTLAAKAFSAASFSARVRPRWALLGGSLVTAAAASGSTVPQQQHTQQHQTGFLFLS